MRPSAWLVAAAAFGLGAFLPQALEARLVGQRVQSNGRICSYQNQSSLRRPGATTDRRVGPGQPCPTTDPGPTPALVTAVPSMAQLAEERREGSRTTCVYEYLGRRYEQSSNAFMPCTLTPLLVR